MVTLAASLASCGGARPPSAVRPTLHPRGMDPQLRALVEARIADARANDPDTVDTARGAVIVGVLARGELTLFSAGSRSPGGPPVDGDTLFKVCSLTKVFTGVLLADAVLRGHIRLSDEAQTHLTHVTLPRHADGSIRVEHLATYSSGFPWQPTNLVSKANGGYSVAAWRSFLENFALPYAPGTGFQYGNVGYALLGDLLAEHAATSLLALFRTRIFEPLGMRRSAFIGDRPDDENRAQGFNREGKLVALDRDEPSQPAACALETSMNDLMAFLRAHFADSSPLRSAMDLALEPRRQGAAEYAGFDVGLGWFLEDGGRASKTGSITGYRSALALDRARRTAVAVLAADERVDQSLIADGVLSDLAAASDDTPSSQVASLPTHATPYDVKFEDGLRLVGIEAPTEVVLGQDAYVRYFFRVERTPRHEWRAFVHADAKGERVRSDHVLSQPMKSMVPGTLFEDRVKLHFRPGLKNTTFKLYDGFFRGSLRMEFEPHSDAGRFLGPSIRVVPASQSGPP